MIRAINIVLIIAIALQTVGCSTWRPLDRGSGVPWWDKKTPMQELVLGKLKEGMRVRIRIREGARGPTNGEVIEGIIEKIGLTSLTVTPIVFYARGTVSRELTLHYSDIESIEYRELVRELPVFVAGVAVGTILGFFVTGLIFVHQSD